LTSNDDPYEALGSLAEHLSLNEGLSLNAAKTNVIGRKEYVRRLDRLTTDVSEEVEGVALDVLTATLYFDEEPDEDALNQLKGLNLVELLKEEVDADPWDIGRIKVIFRALKIVKPKEAVDFIAENFSDLVVFAKEICLLMETLEEEWPGCFDDLCDDVVDAILKPPASSVQLLRTWLLELFVRGVIGPASSRMKELENLPAVVDKRQLLLIHGRLSNKNFFRKQKTAAHAYSEFDLPYLVWGASCLPKDEYESWLDSIKGRVSRPLGRFFLKWAAKNRPQLINRLKSSAVDLPE
jgi:hypothetical protein